MVSIASFLILCKDTGLTPDPPWVIEHALKAQLAEVRAASEARAERLAAAREKERQMRLSNSSGAFRAGFKRAKIGSGSGVNGEDAKDKSGLEDDDFLPEDKEDENDDEDGSNLSKEVRDLMAKWVSTSRPRDWKTKGGSGLIPGMKLLDRSSASKK